MSTIKVTSLLSLRCRRRRLKKWKTLRWWQPKGKATAEEAEATLARITTATDMGALAECDVIVEAVTENLAVKQEIFGRLDALVAHSPRVDPDDPAWRARAERRAWLSRYWPSALG